MTADFAKKYMTSGDVVGARLKMGGADSDDPWRTVVGVVADIRHTALDQEPRPEVWLPFSQLPDDLLTTWLQGRERGGPDDGRSCVNDSGAARGHAPDSDRRFH